MSERTEEIKQYSFHKFCCWLTVNEYQKVIATQSYNIFKFVFQFVLFCILMFNQLNSVVQFLLGGVLVSFIAIRVTYLYLALKRIPYLGKVFQLENFITTSLTFRLSEVIYNLIFRPEIKLNIKKRQGLNLDSAHRFVYINTIISLMVYLGIFTAIVSPWVAKLAIFIYH